jgi:hypothetical protein
MKLLTWEDIDYHKIWRSKIFGGWLVKTFDGEAASITFVPDPKHEWDGTSLP